MIIAPLIENQRSEFKSWTELFAFHFEQMTFEKAWIPPLSVMSKY